MNFRKLFFSFLFLISSLFLIDQVKVKAETTEPVSSKYFDIYSSEMLSRIETDYFNSGITEFDTKFNEIYEEYKNDYPFYMIISQCNFSNSCIFKYYIFDSIPNFKWKIYYGNSKLYQILWNDEAGVGNFNYRYGQKDIYLNYSNTINNLKFDTTIYNQSNLSWDKIVYHFSFSKENNRFYGNGSFVYDSNFDITMEDNHALKSSRENVDIKVKDTYYQADDVIPSYKEFKNPKPKTPYIDSSIEDIDSVTIDDIKYVQKKKLKLKFNNYNLVKYKIFIAHDVPHGFYEITPNLVTNTYSINFEKDSILYLKILDRETDEVIYTQTFDISNISYPIPSLKLTLTDTEYLGDNQTIAPLHYTYLAEFNYFNTEKYTYKYYYPDFDSIINMLENDKYINVGVNGNMIFYVYDNDTGELVYTHTLDITGLYGAYFPQISMKLYETEYLNCGDEKRVYSVAIDVFFSILDKSKYIYEYSFGGVNYDKYNITSDGHYFRHTIYSNSILYVRIKDINNDDVIVSQTFDISNITYDKDDITCILGNNFNSNIEALQKYLVELKETSEIFNQIFNSFYKSLPTVISQGLAYVYIIILIFVALKIGGWK